MDGDERTGAPESAPSAPDQVGQIPTDRMVRLAWSLAGAAVSSAAWGVAAALDLARLGTSLALRVSADLAGRAGLALRGPVDVSRDLGEEANRALVARLYRALVETDLATTRELVAEDVRWAIPPPDPMAGHYRGVAAAAPALAGSWRQLGDVQAVELRDVVVSPEGLLRLSVVREGRSMTLDRWVVFRIEHGRVTEAWGPFTAEPGGAPPSTNDADPDDADLAGVQAREWEP